MRLEGALLLDFLSQGNFFEFNDAIARVGKPARGIYVSI